MKKSIIISTALFSLFGPMTISSAAESKRTANFLLSAPLTYSGKSVTLDVAMVRPVQWKSPYPELVFFHALTMDRRVDRPDGVLLVAVSAEESAAFAKKYGTNFDGRKESDSMKGVFMPNGRNRGWIIDVSGKLATLMQERKLEIPDDKGDDLAEHNRKRQHRLHRP